MNYIEKLKQIKEGLCNEAYQDRLSEVIGMVDEVIEVAQGQTVAWRGTTDTGRVVIFQFPLSESDKKIWKVEPLFLAPPPQPVAVPSDVAVKLIAVARAAFHAADDSEEVYGPDGRQHVIGSADFDALSDALDALEELPDDKPGCAMNGPAKAEWALRETITTKPVAVPEVFKAMVNSLLDQIDRSDFVDSNGHNAKMLKPVHDLMKYLAAAPEVQQPKESSDENVQG